MLRRTMLALVAGSVIFSAAPASARPTGGIWADHGPKKKRSRPKAPAAVQESQEAIETVNPTTADAQAVEQANPNSALTAGAVPAGSLSELKLGLNVMHSSGAYLGRVSQVVTASDQSIQLVIVAGTDGKTYRLYPDRITIAGGVVSTTQTDIR